MVFEHDFEKFPELSNSQLETLEILSPHKQIKEDFRAVVVKVHDGDTVTLRTDFRDFDFPLRLLDIDSPEMNEGGEVTQQWLQSKLLGNEITVLINSRKRVGKYGRLLGRIFFNGLDIGQEEIIMGLAKPFGTKEEGKLPSFQKQFSLKQWV